MWEKEERQDKTLPLGDVLVHVAITESQTNLQRKTIYLSLMSFQKVHYERLSGEDLPPDDRMGRQHAHIGV